jgi:hypothetical protein
MPACICLMNAGDTPAITDSLLLQRLLQLRCCFMIWCDAQNFL